MRLNACFPNIWTVWPIEPQWGVYYAWEQLESRFFLWSSRWRKFMLEYSICPILRGQGSGSYNMIKAKKLEEQMTYPLTPFLWYFPLFPTDCPIKTWNESQSISIVIKWPIAHILLIQCRIKSTSKRWKVNKTVFPKTLVRVLPMGKVNMQKYY